MSIRRYRLRWAGSYHERQPYCACGATLFASPLAYAGSQPIPNSCAVSNADSVSHTEHAFECGRDNQNRGHAGMAMVFG